MKSLLAAALVFLSLPLLAQTDSSTPPPAPPPGSGGGQGANYAAMIEQATSTLTPEEKTELQTARQKAMAANPDLQAEEMGLMQKVLAMQSGSANDDDRHALGDEMRAHGDKVRAAMIKEDPNVQPIIVKVETQVAKIKAELQAAAH